MKCFIIIGPANSGTRLVTRLFLKNGCIGSDGFWQDYDKQLPPPEQNIVWKTHRFEYIQAGIGTRPLSEIVDKAQSAGYDIQLVFVYRDLQVLYDGSIKRGYKINTPHKFKFDWYRKAFDFAEKTDLPSVFISYDLLVSHPRGYVKRLSKQIKYPLPDWNFIVDMNGKHLGDKMTDDRGFKLLEVKKNGIPFYVRDGTVDINVLDEVITGDCYQLEKIKLRKQPNIIDVGGHIGGFTKYAAWRWPHGTFYTYEANSRNWDMIERNLADIRHKVTLYKGACVGKEPVNKRLVINSMEADRVTGGWGIIYNDEPYEPSQGEAFENIENFYSLDNLIPALDKVDILKLDCEGSEWSILWELTEEQLHKVDYIVCELHCGALSHAPCDYKQMRRKILKQFICPQLDARNTVDSHALFNFVACNRKLIGG
jgi:FkbM family methyltransferase